jgi:hypothetical protein
LQQNGRAHALCKQSACLILISSEKSFNFGNGYFFLDVKIGRIKYSFWRCTFWSCQN